MATQRRKRGKSTPKQSSKTLWPTEWSAPSFDYAFGSLLYTEPSFLSGLASVLDIGSTLTDFNYSLSPWQADYFALLSDHRAIAADYKKSTQHFNVPDQKAS